MNARSHTFDIALPAEPVISVRAGRRNWLDLDQLWQYRELLGFLTVRDIKVRYKQAALGVLWVVLQPLVTMAVFSLIFGRLANVPSDGVPYPLFAFAGLLPWLFFSSAVSNSSNSLVGSANLVSKVYFPRLLIPGAAVGAALFDLCISSTLMIGLLAWYQQPLTGNLLLLIPLVPTLVLLVLSVGMAMAALNVKYRDIRYVLPFCLQLGMFVTPVIFPVSFVPEKYRALAYLNPMAGVVEGIRAALFGLPIPITGILIAMGLTGVLFIGSVTLFRQMERSFADVI